MLDPAVGNSIFFQYAKRVIPKGQLSGYEIDDSILQFFGNPAEASIKKVDYLLNDWDDRYDAIVCNPPYNRFQSIANRAEIIDSFYEHVGTKYSSYTNLYVLFLIKSIYQMSDTGRLAYIVPTEFLNSKYGTAVKRLMLDNGLLKAVINFSNNQELFSNATTTCCILLLDKTSTDVVKFYNVNSISDLESVPLNLETTKNCIPVSYSLLDPEKKWRIYLYQEEMTDYRNLTNVSTFCSVSRGIATGANSFFCLSDQARKDNNIDMKYLSRCICRSADVQKNVFTEEYFESLMQKGKTVFLLDVKEDPNPDLMAYIRKGEIKGYNKKYLPSKRDPWYSMEQRKPAPIWVSSACRDKIKFVRNLASTKSLTTFHSVYIHELFSEYTDIIFCYFLTPIAQDILRQNRKELGNGLDKFQPNDLNNALMLDVTLISEADRKRILALYESIQQSDSKQDIDALNTIFESYLLN